jgi:hypothetical protein
MGNALDNPTLVLLAVVIVGGLIWLIVRLTRRTEGEVAVAPGAPGWYRQPDGTMRWWNGKDWTEPPQDS